jgi:acetate kinase
MAVNGGACIRVTDRIGLYVVATDEELMIARHTVDLLASR